MAPDPPADSASGRSEDQPGWGAPSLPPTEPTTAPLPPPGMPASPPPGTASPGAPSFATPAPGWATTTTKPRSRRWIVVLVAALGLVVAAAVAGTLLFVDRTLPPYNAAHDFIHDVIRGNTSAAAARLCADDREDVQGAISSVTDHFTFGGSTVAVNVLTVDRDGNRANVDVDITNSSHSSTFTLAMRQEGGTWKACPV
jgi:hypothetical protein